MDEGILSTFGIVESLAWGAVRRTLAAAMGEDVRIVVAGVKEAGPPGSWWGFDIRGALQAKGGVVFSEGLRARLGDRTVDVVRQATAQLAEILTVPLTVQVAATPGEAPTGDGWVEVSLKVTAGETAAAVQAYLDADGVKAIAEAFGRHEEDIPSSPQEAGGDPPPGAEDRPADEAGVPPEVRAHRWPPLEGGLPQTGVAGLEMFYDVPLTLTAELGRVERKVEDVMTLGPGAVVELDRMVGESIDLFANGQWIGRGEVVVVEENFAVRITEIGTATERLSKLRLREGS